jgi:hypothetical protein
VLNKIDALLTRKALTVNRSPESSKIPLYRIRSESLIDPFRRLNGTSRARACTNRIFGGSKLSRRTMSTGRGFCGSFGKRWGSLVHSSRRLFIPPDVVGNCCATVWRSKGYNASIILMANRVVESMWRWSKQGSLPIVSDASSCTFGLKQEVLDYLTPETGTSTST